MKLNVSSIKIWQFSWNGNLTILAYFLLILTLLTFKKEIFIRNVLGSRINYILEWWLYPSKLVTPARQHFLIGHLKIWPEFILLSWLITSVKPPFNQTMLRRPTVDKMVKNDRAQECAVVVRRVRARDKYLEFGWTHEM